MTVCHLQQIVLLHQVLSIFNHFSVTSVVQSPHEVCSNIVVAALPTIGEPNEAEKERQKEREP